MQSLTIRNKVVATFALLFLLLAVQSTFLIVQSDRLQKSSNMIANRDQVIMASTYEFQIAVIQVQQWLTDISATRGMDGLNDGFDKAAASYETAQRLIDELLVLDAENASAYESIKPALESFYSVGKGMAETYVRRGAVGGNEKMPEFDAAAGTLIEEVDNLMAFTKARFQDRLARQSIAAELMKQTTFVSSIIFLVMMIFLVIVALRNILVPINKMAKLARDLAEGEGDLTKRLDDSRRDELGITAASINLFVAKTQETIRAMSSVAREIATAARHLASLAVQTDENMSSQLQESQQVATAMSEMLASAQEVARNTSDTAAETQGVNEESRSGKVDIETTTDKIEALAAEMDEAQRVVAELGEQSANIGSVLDVIKGISEQTNLLALNAAIEAARAGEQGRGFAVVADEVRSLASRTQQSTEEIQAMIDRLQSSSSKAVSVIDEGGKLVHISVSSVQQASVSLDVINSRIARISQMNNQIATAAEEQSLVLGEIDKNITNISRVAQSNAQSVTLLNRTGKQLQSNVQQLDKLMEQFKY
ncbi:MAG: methyl-accepting chemotaxis protein [Gammaproteobacteria bacterium]|nr:methyl-accepting chemotaxis protein [Gammaproteobacteria bacterium]